MLYYRILKLILLIIILFELLLLLLHISTSDQQLYKFFSYSYSSIVFLGGIAALWASSYWGQLKSYIGKTLLFIAMGQFANFLGQNSCALIRITQQLDKCPYPSFAEIFFVSSIFLYIAGSYTLAKSMGAVLSLKYSTTNKIIAGIVGVIMFVVAMYKFTEVNAVTSFVDIGTLVEDNGFVYLILELIYPFGASVYTAIALLATMWSVKTTKGVLHWNCLLILIAFMMQFAGDTMYIWTSGLVSDTLYLISFTCISLSSLFFVGSAISLNSKHNG